MKVDASFDEPSSIESFQELSLEATVESLDSSNQSDMSNGVREEEYKVTSSLVQIIELAPEATELIVPGMHLPLGETAAQDQNSNSRDSSIEQRANDSSLYDESQLEDNEEESESKKEDGEEKNQHQLHQHQL